MSLVRHLTECGFTRVTRVGIRLIPGPTRDASPAPNRTLTTARQRLIEPSPRIINQLGRASVSSGDQRRDTLAQSAGTARSNIVSRLPLSPMPLAGADLQPSVAADCGLRCGSSGSEARCDLPNCGSGARAKTLPLKRRAALTVCGGWPIARHSPSRYPMFTSTRSGFRD